LFQSLLIFVKVSKYKYSGSLVVHVYVTHKAFDFNNVSENVKININKD